MRLLQMPLTTAVLLGTILALAPAEADETPPAPAREVPTAVPGVFEREADFGKFDEPIESIAIEGNELVKPEDVIKLIESRAFLVPGRERIERDVAVLRARSWFSSVTVGLRRTEEGAVLVFKVVERPALERITFVGNEWIGEDELAEWCGLKTGPGYDVSLNRKAAARIRQLYNDMGYLSARVRLETGDSPDDREVAFRIDEGPQAIITAIDIAGNTLIPTSLLKLRLKESTHLLWGSDGRYWPAFSGTAREWTRTYQDRGYLDVDVDRRHELSADGKHVRLEFRIDEGARYRIRKIKFTGNGSIPSDTLRELLDLRPGESFDRRRIDGCCRNLANRYAAKTGSQVAFYPVTEHTNDPGYVDLRFVADESPESSDGNPVTSAEPTIHTTAGDAHPDVSPSEQKATRISNPASSAASGPPAAVREINRLVFEGVETFEPEEIRDVLAIDFETILAAHQNRSLADFLTAIEKQVRTGYLHGGFAEARVHARYDDDREQIVVQVSEGRRQLCGDMQIAGVTHLAAADLTAAVTDSWKPGGNLWERGNPAHFDDYTATRIHKRLEEAFAAAGYFMASFDVAPSPGLDAATCNLKVAVHREGPRATVGKISITGTKRDSAADVLRYLGLQPGMPYDSGLADRLHERLYQSGRYLTIAVEPKAGPSQATEAAADPPPDVRNLAIKLREHDGAPPLREELSPAQQALIKLCDWLQRWANGKVDDEIIITSTAGPAPAAARRREDGSLFENRFSLRMVLSPYRGQTIAAKATTPEGKQVLDVVFAAYPDRLVLASPNRRAKVVLPNRHDLAFACTLKQDRAVQRYAGDYPLQLKLSYGFVPRAPEDASPLQITGRLTPVCGASLAEPGQSKCTFRDGTWEIHKDDARLTIRIDDASGRLVACTWDDPTLGIAVSIVTEKDALESERRKLEPMLASAEEHYEPASPWKSVAQFIAEEWLAGVRAEGYGEWVKPLEAACKLISRWSGPAIGGPLESLIASVAPPENAFRIPSHLSPLSLQELQQPSSESRRNLVARHLLPAYRRLIPKTGWYWPVGRDAGLSWASGGPVGSILSPAAERPDVGAIGGLILAQARTWLGSARKAAAGDVGPQQLRADDFRKDYQPFLAGDSWIGASLLALAESLRGLDESELWALARLLPADWPREEIVRSLLPLSNDHDKPIREILARVLDALWSNMLQSAGEKAADFGAKRTDVARAKADRLRRFAPDDGDLEPGGNDMPALDPVPDLWGWRRRELYVPEFLDARPVNRR